MKILFLAANPTTMVPLDIERELGSVRKELKGVRHRDRIVLLDGLAVEPDDLIAFVSAERPTIIHFSGHASSNGIVLRTEGEGDIEISGENLRVFLQGRGIELLVLNACCTQQVALDLGEVVGAVVGTTQDVYDEAARRFAVAFYRSLGNGSSIGDAFRDGRDAVALYGFGDRVFWSAGDLGRVPLPEKPPPPPPPAPLPPGRSLRWLAVVLGLAIVTLSAIYLYRNHARDYEPPAAPAPPIAPQVHDSATLSTPSTPGAGENVASGQSKTGGKADTVAAMDNPISAAVGSTLAEAEDAMEREDYGAAYDALRRACLSLPRALRNRLDATVLDSAHTAMEVQKDAAKAAERYNEAFLQVKGGSDATPHNPHRPVC